MNFIKANGFAIFGLVTSVIICALSAYAVWALCAGTTTVSGMNPEIIRLIAALAFAAAFMLAPSLFFQRFGLITGAITGIVMFFLPLITGLAVTAGPTVDLGTGNVPVWGCVAVLGGLVTMACALVHVLVSHEAEPSVT